MKSTIGPVSPLQRPAIHCKPANLGRRERLWFGFQGRLQPPDQIGLIYWHDGLISAIEIAIIPLSPKDTSAFGARSALLCFATEGVSQPEPRGAPALARHRPIVYVLRERAAGMVAFVVVIIARQNGLKPANGADVLTRACDGVMNGRRSRPD